MKTHKPTVTYYSFMPSYSCSKPMFQTAEYVNSGTVPPRFFIEKKLAHLPSFSHIQSDSKALIFIVFNTYFVAYWPLTHSWSALKICAFSAPEISLKTAILCSLVPICNFVFSIPKSGFKTCSAELSKRHFCKNGRQLEVNLTATGGQW